MASGIVAALAKLRRSHGQKFGNIAAMGSMAIQTILLNGWMLPHVWASFFGMAAVAEFVHRVRLNHVLAKAAMMIVAVCTFDFSFPDRMVGLLIFLRPDGPMANIAEVRLSGF
jgi:hypothetical protein